MSVQLTPLKEIHLKKTFEWLQDPQLRAAIDSLTEPVWVTHEQVWKKRFLDPSRADFAILDGDQHIGNCGLSSIDLIRKKAELWIYLGDSGARGKGAEAINKLFQFGFQEKNLDRIYLRVLTTNQKAVRFYNKVGMREEGLLRKDSLVSGKRTDSILFAILKEEFKP